MAKLGAYIGFDRITGFSAHVAIENYSLSWVGFIGRRLKQVCVLSSS
jgi:hypothetical protein